MHPFVQELLAAQRGEELRREAVQARIADFALQSAQKIKAGDGRRRGWAGVRRMLAGRRAVPRGALPEPEGCHVAWDAVTLAIRPGEVHEGEGGRSRLSEPPEVDA